MLFRSAEALALLLAVTLANLLQLQHVTFLTDNLTLAKAAAALKTADQQVPWEIRQHIAQYKLVSQELDPKIYHIKRDLNGVAHNCAHQALRHSDNLSLVLFLVVLIQLMYMAIAQ